MNGPLPDRHERFLLAIGIRGEPGTLGLVLHRAGLPAREGRALVAALEARGLVVASGGYTTKVTLTNEGSSLALALRNAAALAERAA